MSDFSQFFLYIPGVILFLISSGQVRNWLHSHRSGFSAEATVLACRHVVKKDSKGREVYNYYNVTIEYIDPSTSHKTRQTIKNPSEFSIGQQLRIYQDKAANAPVLTENEDQQLFHPFVAMIGSALLILLALWQNKGNQVAAMVCLSLILSGAGISLIYNYLSVKKKNLQVIDGEIIELYERQISKGTKILRGSKSTYYPIVKYIMDGQESIRRCNINSSISSSFKVGEHMNLYYDPHKHMITEKKAFIGILLAGIFLLLIGLLAGASILSVVL